MCGITAHREELLTPNLSAKFGAFRRMHRSLSVRTRKKMYLHCCSYSKNITRTKDGSIQFLRKFVRNNPDARNMYRTMKFPEITEEIIDECLDEIPIETDRDYIRTFNLSGQTQIKELINQNEEFSKDEDNGIGLAL